MFIYGSNFGVKCILLQLQISTMSMYVKFKSNQSDFSDVSINGTKLRLNLISDKGFLYIETVKVHTPKHQHTWEKTTVFHRTTEQTTLVSPINK